MKFRSGLLVAFLSVFLPLLAGCQTPPQLTTLPQAPSIAQEAPLRVESSAVVVPVKAGENRWVRVGANPFSGTPEEGLKLLSYPPEVQKLFRERMAEHRGEHVAMADGTLYRAQVYSVAGEHKVWRNVRQALGRNLSGMLYTVTHEGKTYRLFYPPKAEGGCDNLSDVADGDTTSGGQQATHGSRSLPSSARATHVRIGEPRAEKDLLAPLKK